MIFLYRWFKVGDGWWLVGLCDYRVSSLAKLLIGQKLKSLKISAIAPNFIWDQKVAWWVKSDSSVSLCPLFRSFWHMDTKWTQSLTKIKGQCIYTFPLIDSFPNALIWWGGSKYINFTHESKKDGRRNCSLF